LIPEGDKMKKEKFFLSLAPVRNHPRLRQYYKDCKDFLTYLREKERVMIEIDAWDSEKDDYAGFTIPYKHRWKSQYMKTRLARLYMLDEWAKQNPLPLSMLTFTTYHDSDYARKHLGKGISIEESWDILKGGFWKASLLIRNKIRKGVSYLWFTEAQPESGYPHIHAGYFTEFTDAEQERLKNHWSKVLKVGDYKHGLNFKFEKNFKTGEIASYRNYCMKYMVKTLVESLPEWTPQELVFNAIAWKKGYRFFGCSRDLSKAMTRPRNENLAICWYRTSLVWPDNRLMRSRVLREYKKKVDYF
jgi:hypothetical protein